MLGGLVLAVVLVAGSVLFAATQRAPTQPAASVSTPPSTLTSQASAVAALALPTLAAPATLKPLPTEAPSTTPAPTATPQPTETPLPTATPTPLPMPAWAEVGNLTSVEYLNTVVIERERPKSGIGQVIPGTDRLVLMAVGKIHAGVDLQKIKASDVQINGKAIRIVLPRASILAVELQPADSRIFESDRTWLYSEYEGLELEALDEAKQKLRDNSSHNVKMLELAEKMARLQLTELLRKLGYEQIEIVFEP